MGLQLPASFVNLPITDGISGYKPSTVLSAKKEHKHEKWVFSPTGCKNAACVSASWNLTIGTGIWNNFQNC